MNAPLPVRIAVLVALGLLVAAAVADLYGAKTEARFSGAASQGNGQAVIIAVMALTSSGTVDLRLQGFNEAYYFKLYGSPMKALSQISTLGIKLENERFVYDVRAGFGYGEASVVADPAVIASLPALASGTTVGVLEGGEAAIVEKLESGQGLAVIAIAEEGGVVSYQGIFKVEGYDRLNGREALAVAGVAAGLPIVVWLGAGWARRWRGKGER